MKQSKATLAITLLGLALTAAGSQAATPTAAQKAKGQEVTKKLTALLNKRIQTTSGGKLQIKIVPAARADQGYFSEIFISANPARIKKLRFSELTLRARNVRISPTSLLKDNKLVTLASTTTMRAVITEDEVTEALAKGRSSKDKDLKVKFVAGKVRVTGKWSMSWFSGPMEAVGKLRLGTGHTVMADIETLKLNGKQVPDGLKKKFSDKINPLVDYTDLPFRPPFKAMRVTGTKAIITA